MYMRANFSLKRADVTPAMLAAKPDKYISQDCEYSLFIYQHTAVVDFRNIDTGEADITPKGCRYYPAKPDVEE